MQGVKCQPVPDRMSYKTLKTGQARWCEREEDREKIREKVMCVSRCVHTQSHTHPECVRGDGAWVMTDPDWEEDRDCWAARLQLGAIMEVWVWGWCRAWVWGWCSGGWGCGFWGWGGCWSWSWGLSCCWFIQDGPLWQSVCRGGTKKTAGTILYSIDGIWFHSNVCTSVCFTI